MTETRVQYIIMRSDLMKALKWPVGAVIAQACHACTAVLHTFRDHSDTIAYLSELNSMHKVVLEAPDVSNLKQLASELEEAGIDHKLWIEQPENEATCLATRPYRRQEVQAHFKRFKLMK